MSTRMDLREVWNLGSAKVDPEDEEVLPVTVHECRQGS